MKLNQIKSSILENALDSILAEWEESIDGEVVIESTNIRLIVESVQSSDGEITINLKIKSQS